MARKIMTKNHKLMSYLLTEEFGRTQQQVATMFEVSQSTINGAIKEARFLVQIESMKKELDVVRTKLIEQGIKAPEIPLLNTEKIIDVIE